MSDTEMDMGTPEPNPGSRELAINLNTSEIIMVDLDMLEENPDELLNVLMEGQSSVYVWTQLANEYIFRDLLESAEKVLRTGERQFTETNRQGELAPLYLLLANIQMIRARGAPKLILENAQLDKLSGATKDTFLQDAATLQNFASTNLGAERRHLELMFLTRGIHQLSRQSTMQEALETLNNILKESPTNLMALHGKARICYAKRSYGDALQLYLRILRLSPYSKPDPRIGIGLCQWQLGNKDKAKAAWQRSLQLDGNQWAAELLLGVEALNSSKDAKTTDHQRSASYAAGFKHIERAFNSNQKNAASANCLAEYFIRRGDARRALKLSERAIQYADTLAVVQEGRLRAARVAHMEKRYDDAFTQYNLAKSLPLASIGMAQIHILKDEPAAAIHILDSVVGQHKSLEAQVMLASLRASHRPALTDKEYATDKEKARDAFERVKKEVTHLLNINGSANGAPKLNTHRTSLIEDVEMHLELGRLWQSDSVEKAIQAYDQAVTLLKRRKGASSLDPRIINNIAALHHIDGKFEAARTLYEEALGGFAVSGTGDDASDAASTTILYNLARVYEDAGESTMAKEAYDKLLTRHPEYIDAKVRLAHLLLVQHRTNEAHEILKQALVSQTSNLNLRAYYTHFLLQSNLFKPALNFVFATLKEFGQRDVYAYCAAAWLHYHFAREIRDSAPEAIRDRRKKFVNAAEFFEKALHQDPGCAVAAQGLAIIVAEDALGVMSLRPPGEQESHETRMKNTREALDVFAKIRESLNDGSVYANMGHCYYARDEYERAIESYETASRRFYNGQNVPVLMCLSRSWYAKATKDSSFRSILTALKYAQEAQHIQPNDKAIRYNIAMIQQKAGEMIIGLPVHKRTLDELKQGLEHASQSQQVFAALAEDKSTDSLPYSRDLAKQRQLYGQSLLRKGADQEAQQEKHESEHKARLDAARAIRDAERAEREALEAKRQEEIRRRAEELAEERRRAREVAQEWSAAMKAESSEDDKTKKKRGRKATSGTADGGGGGGGDESGSEREPEKPRKSKKSRIRKGKGKESAPGSDEGVLFSGDEEEKKPRESKKRGSRKRVVNDDDDDEIEKPSKKRFKTGDWIEDSDEEIAALDRKEAAAAAEQARLAALVPPLTLGGGAGTPEAATGD